MFIYVSILCMELFIWLLGVIFKPQENRSGLPGLLAHGGGWIQSISFAPKEQSWSGVPGPKKHHIQTPESQILALTILASRETDDFSIYFSFFHIIPIIEQFSVVKM